MSELDAVQQIVVDRLGILVDTLHAEARILEVRYGLPAEDSREAADVISELRKQVQQAGLRRTTSRKESSTHRVERELDHRRDRGGYDG